MNDRGQCLLFSFGWGYDRIVGARAKDIPPAPKRKQTTSWKDFIRSPMAVLVATDFFTVEVLTLRGLITYYVLFFIHLESRRICLAGVTHHPNAGTALPGALGSTGPVCNTRLW